MKPNAVKSAHPRTARPKSPQEPVSPLVLKRLLRKEMKQLDAMIEELREVESRMAVPSAYALRRIKLQLTPIHAEPLFLGVLRAVLASLSNATRLISDHTGYSPSQLRKHRLAIQAVPDEILQGLASAVNDAARRNRGTE
jgi:hypothetical protein